MQSLNNDMDDLFRRAAEGYPLKSEGADWDKVRSMLDNLDQKGKGGRRKATGRKRYLWLLVLLPLLLFLVTDQFEEHGSGYRPQKSGDQLPPTSHLENESQNKLPSFSPSFKKSNSLRKMNGESKEAADPVFTEGSLPEKHLSATSGQKNLKGKPAPATETIAAVQKHEKPQDKVPSGSLAASGREKAQALIGSDEPIAPPSKKLPEVVETTQQEAGQIAIGKANLPQAKDQNAAGITDQEDKKETDAPARIQKKNRQSNQEQDSLPPVNPSEKPRSRHWYAGLLLGPDLSSVKRQKVEGAGYSFGLVAGYRLGKKWAVETGALLEKKQYYSTGQYFKTGKMMLPQHAKVLQGDGSCRMIELPVSVRYTVASKNGHSWFASAGASSYLMNREDYYYQYDVYGSPYYTDKSYKNASKNWFSIMHLSAGYETRIGNSTTIRIEPYYKIPLKGVGISGLPISSAGLYVGVTKAIR